MTPDARHRHTNDLTFGSSLFCPLGRWISNSKTSPRVEIMFNSVMLAQPAGGEVAGQDTRSQPAFVTPLGKKAFTPGLPSVHLRNKKVFGVEGHKLAKSAAHVPRRRQYRKKGRYHEQHRKEKQGHMMFGQKHHQTTQVSNQKSLKQVQVIPSP